MMSADPLERLTAIAEIWTLKARYFRLLDAHDWDGLADLFLPDAVLTVPLRPEGLVRDEALAFYREHMTPIESIHHGFMPEITVHEANRASALWRMEDRLYRRTGTPDVYDLSHGFGTYTDEYALLEGRWRFSSTSLVRSRQDLFPGVRRVS